MRLHVVAGGSAIPRMQRKTRSWGSPRTKDRHGDGTLHHGMNLSLNYAEHTSAAFVSNQSGLCYTASSRFAGGSCTAFIPSPSIIPRSLHSLCPCSGAYCSPPSRAVHFVSMVLKSWLPVSDDSDFSIENLPFGIFSTKDNVRCCRSSAFHEYNLNHFEEAELSMLHSRLPVLVQPLATMSSILRHSSRLRSSQCIAHVNSTMQHYSGYNQWITLPSIASFISPRQQHPSGPIRLVPGYSLTI